MIRIFFIFSALLSVAAAGFLALSGFSGTEGEITSDKLRTFDGLEA